MKILHVITSLESGGAEKLVVDLLPRLRSYGDDVELLVINGKETPLMHLLEQRDVKIWKLMPSFKGYYRPENILAFRRFLKSHNYDVIHTHNTGAQILGALATNVGLVTTEHNTTNRRRRFPILKIFDCWMYRQYDNIICVSNDSADSLNHYIDLRNKVGTVLNGIDLKSYSSDIKELEDGECVKIIMVAGFRPQKDQDTLIKSIKYLPERYKFRLVGDGERRHELESLASQYHVLDRVEFMGVRQDIPSLLHESDIVVMSSHYEGLSLSSVEGMASGRPFIASDVPGLHEVVGGAGILFPEGDAEALASAIKSLCESPSEYKKVAQRCQERAQIYDIDKTAAAYHKIYSDLLNTKH